LRASPAANDWLYDKRKVDFTYDRVEQFTAVSNGEVGFATMVIMITELCLNLANVLHFAKKGWLY